MLRDNRQAALDHVLLALEHATDAYADAVRILRDRDAAMADLFDQLAQRRGAMAAELTEQRRRLGDLPSEPNSDREESAEQLMRHVKATVASDERPTLRDEALAREDEIRTAIAAALTADPPEQAADLLRRFAEEIVAARTRLEGAVCRQS